MVLERYVKNKLIQLVNRKIEGKKIFHNIDQKTNVKLNDGASVNLMPTSIYKKINPQMFYEDRKPRLDNVYKD